MYHKRTALYVPFFLSTGEQNNQVNYREIKSLYTSSNMKRKKKPIVNNADNKYEEPGGGSWSLWSVGMRIQQTLSYTWLETSAG